MRRIVIALALALVVTGLSIWVWTGYRSLDAEELGARWIAQMVRERGLQVEAEQTLLHPLRGLEMKGVVLSGRIRAGDLHATIGSVRIRHRWLPMLWRRWVFDEVWIQEPDVQLTSLSITEARVRRQARKLAKEEKARSEASAPDAESVETLPILVPTNGDPRLQLTIDLVRMDGARIRVRTASGDRDEWAAESVSLEIRELELDSTGDSPIAAVSGAGRLTTGRVRFGDLEAQRSRGQVSVANGEISVDGFEIEFSHGAATVRSTSVSLRREPIRYEIHAEGRVDLNGLFAVGAQAGFGAVNLDLDLRGKGPNGMDAVGQGSLLLSAGVLPDIPLTQEVDSLAGRPLLTGERYSSTRIDYRIEDQKLVLEPFEIVGEAAIVGGSGAIAVAGQLDLDAYVRLNGDERRDRAQRPDLESALLQGLAGLKIPFRVTGPLDRPVVSATRQEGLGAAVDSEESWLDEALAKAKEKAEEWLDNSDDD